MIVTTRSLGAMLSAKLIPLLANPHAGKNTRKVPPFCLPILVSKVCLSILDKVMPASLTLD